MALGMLLRIFVVEIKCVADSFKWMDKTKTFDEHAHLNGRVNLSVLIRTSNLLQVNKFQSFNVSGFFVAYVYLFLVLFITLLPARR